MRDFLKYKLSPSVFGIVSCVLLICSRLMLQSGSGAVGAVNYCVVLITLCLCVHFVRGTAQLFDRHVWEMPALITLICMPVFNLVVTLLQLIVPGAAFWEHPVFSLVLVAFSLPAFFCYYFIYIIRKFPSDRALKTAAAALFLVGGTFLLFRMCDSALFPLIGAYTPFEVLPVLRSAVAVSNRFSFVMYLLIYALSIVCFALFGRMLVGGAKARRPQE